MELWKAGTHTWLWGGDGNLPARTIASRGFSGKQASNQATKLVFGLLSGGPIQFHVKLNEALGTPIP